MFGTIVVKMCNFAMRHARSMRWAVADRAYWFLWGVRNSALGFEADTVKPPCWYCVVGAKNRNDPEDVSCRYCLSGDPNPEAERYRQKDIPLEELADSGEISYCGCAEPGIEVLACGHCGCGESVLCWEWVVTSSGLVKRRKVSCA